MYGRILAVCQSLLDQLVSMRTVTTREAWYSTVRRDFVLPVSKERREMVRVLPSPHACLSRS